MKLSCCVFSTMDQWNGENSSFFDGLIFMSRFLHSLLTLHCVELDLNLNFIGFICLWKSLFLLQCQLNNR